jgi:hypothetical protein
MQRNHMALKQVTTRNGTFVIWKGVSGTKFQFITLHLSEIRILLTLASLETN